MSVVSTPLATQAGGQVAAQFRRLIQAGFTRPAIVGETDLAVTQSGTPAMSVQVATGQVVVAGSENPFQGFYFVENQGSATLTVAGSDPTNDRIDLVVARVADQEYSGIVTAASLVVVTGTPAVSPVEPSPGNNAFVLARVAVGHGVSSILNANITDQRTQRAGQSGLAGKRRITSGVGGSASSTGTTEAIASGFTANLISGRRYMIRGKVKLGADTGGNLAQAILRISTGTVTTSSTSLDATQEWLVTAGGPGQEDAPIEGEYVAAATGIHNIAIGIKRASGSGNSQVVSSTLYVYDES